MNNPFASKVAEEIRDLWQARILNMARGILQRVFIAAFANEYKDAMRALIYAIGGKDIALPTLCGYATISPGGRLICDELDSNGSKRKIAIYETEGIMLYEARKLADKLKLSDADRKEMFVILQKWIARDMRIGAFGQRLAS